MRHVTRGADLISRLLASIALASCSCLFTACSNADTKGDDPNGGTAGTESTDASTAGTGGRNSATNGGRDSATNGGRNSATSGASNGGETTGHAGTTGQASGKGVVRLNLRAK